MGTPCHLEQVEERLGPASQSLEALLAEGHAESFDLAFIGAPALLWLDMQLLAIWHTSTCLVGVFVAPVAAAACCPKSVSC